MMQDRFRFRAWDTHNNKYIYDAEMTYDDIGVRAECFGYMVDDYYNYEYIVEQCTGLKDKNGKLIYEGDIVKEISFDEDSGLGREFEETSVICFGGGDYPCSFTMKSERFYRGFALLNYGINRLELEVIGNIHENPELLEENKKNTQS
jgi:uncharacterized phage protein (TIGR01671 family)